MQVDNRLLHVATKCEVIIAFCEGEKASTSTRSRLRKKWNIGLMGRGCTKTWVERKNMVY